MKRVLVLGALVIGMQAAAFAQPVQEVKNPVKPHTISTVNSDIKAGQQKVKKSVPVVNQDIKVGYTKAKTDQKGWFTKFKHKFDHKKGSDVNARVNPVPPTPGKVAAKPPLPKDPSVQPAQVS